MLRGSQSTYPGHVAASFAAIRSVVCVIGPERSALQSVVRAGEVAANRFAALHVVTLPLFASLWRCLASYDPTADALYTSETELFGRELSAVLGSLSGVLPQRPTVETLTYGHFDSQLQRLISEHQPDLMVASDAPWWFMRRLRTRLKAEPIVFLH